MGDRTYENYKKRLAGEKVPTHDGDPDAGFYRKPVRTSRENGNKITGWEPVSYFWDSQENRMVGTIGQRDMTSNEVTDLWTYVCAYPVPEDVWRDIDDGTLKDWPRDLIGEPKQASRTAYHNQVVTDAEMAAGQAVFDAQRHHRVADVVGIPAANRTVASNHNQPEELALPPEAVLAEEIRNVIAANNITEIKTDEESAQVAATRNRLNEFKTKATKEKEVEFRPHKDRADAVAKKWNAVIDLADKAAIKARKMLDAYATKKLRERQAEEARIAEQNRVAEEANARLLDRAAATGAEVSVETLIPMQEPVAPKPAAQIKANYGRAVSTKAVQVATIVDQDKVYAFYRTNEQVKALLLKLAQADTDAGITVPGTTVETEARTK